MKIQVWPRLDFARGFYLYAAKFGLIDLVAR